MKPGDRVRSLVSLYRTGVRVGAGEEGTILEVVKGKTIRIRTGFGVERQKTPSRIRVRWDNGEEGWFHEDVLEKIGRISNSAIYARMFTVVNAVTAVPRHMAIEETDMLYDNPRRPPKKWFSDCVRGVRAGARRSGRRVRDPQAVCGAQWQRLSASKKRTAVRRSERRRNPYGYIPNPW